MYYNIILFYCNLFGDYEASLVNNYAKFLAANANKNKLLQKKYYRNNLDNLGVIEAEPVNYTIVLNIYKIYFYINF